MHFDTDPALVACILLLTVSRGWQATRLTREDIDDAARVRYSGGASAILQRRVDGCRAALKVLQFQPIRALQNAGGEQEWVMNTLRLILGTAVITDDALQLFGG